MRYSKQWGVELKESAIRTRKTKYTKDCGKGSRWSRCQSKRCQIKNKDNHCCLSGHCLCKKTKPKIWTHSKCQSTNREMFLFEQNRDIFFCKFFFLHELFRKIFPRFGRRTGAGGRLTLVSIFNTSSALPAGWCTWKCLLHLCKLIFICIIVHPSSFSRR